MSLSLSPLYSLIVLISALPTGKSIEVSTARTVTSISLAQTSSLPNPSHRLLDPILFKNHVSIQSQDSILTAVDRRRQAEAATITSLPDTQFPSETLGIESVANTNGSVVTTLQTDGNPPVQPFPTFTSSVTEATLQAANSTISVQSVRASASPISITATLTLPVSTFETVVSSFTVISVPVPTVVTISSIVVVNSVPSTTISLATSSVAASSTAESSAAASSASQTASSKTGGCNRTWGTWGPIPSSAQTLTVTITSGQPTATTSTSSTQLTGTRSISSTQSTDTASTSSTQPEVTVPTSSAQPTVIISTGTFLSPTTIATNITITGTSFTTVSSGILTSVVPTTTDTSATPTPTDGSQDLFQPVDIGPPPASIPLVGGHPVPRTGITNMTGPIGTNKFYFNFFLGSQSAPAFVMPYSLSWSKGGGNAQSWGMAVSHIDDSQKVYGPNNDKIPGSPASYFINPLGVQSLIMSAAELDTSTVLTTDALSDMSGNAHLSPGNSNSRVTFPMVQGMAFVTAIYDNLQPEIQSGVFYRSVESLGQPKEGVYKYKLNLKDGKVWLLYATPSIGGDPNLQLYSSTLLQGISSWSGSIQVAKLPDGADEKIFDDASAVYPISGTVSGSASESTAQYSLSWTKGGLHAQDSTLLMYALPHHVQSFDQQTTGLIKQVQLQTTTKGLATAVAADSWILNEELHPQMGFDPWRPDSTTAVTFSDQVKAQIQAVAAIEASQDMKAQTNLNSMYFSGKGLSKFATIVYTMNEISDQQDIAATALDNLKAAFATFVNNQQVFPLYYDTDWKGIVSSASYATGDAGVDFGNSYYNDHHFHYGYFIHAAAIIGYLDPAWAQANKEYVNTMVRDVANPSSLDTYFPIFRSFDWYNGHSWAKGLFETSDGKDEESTSEDAMFAYSLKMWGRTVGDVSMERRGDLMLSVVARAIQNYFLMDSDNKNQPASYIPNKATGILFENKCDHVTYFGTNIEYIQGIQMIPALPFSTLTRTQKFVTEEWELYFSDGAVAPAQNVQGGWRGILYGNLAIINPQAAYNFFSQSNFDASSIDGGASLTWYLAYTAGLGGAQ